MSESDLAEGIVQAEAPRHLTPPTPARRDFKSWHRVRKQFIRERQWNHEIFHLAQRLRRELHRKETNWGGETESETTLTEIPESVRIDRPLRFLTLPGEELLDVRSLWRK